MTDLTISINSYRETAVVKAKTREGAEWISLHMLGVLDNCVNLSADGGREIMAAAVAAGLKVEETR